MIIDAFVQEIVAASPKTVLLCSMASAWSTRGFPMPSFPGTRAETTVLPLDALFHPQRNCSRIVGIAEVNRASSHNRFRILLLWRAIRKGQIVNSEGCGVRLELIRLVTYAACKVKFTLPI